MPGKLHTVAELAQLRVQILGLSERLGLKGEPDRPEDRDWSAHRETAVGLLGLLARLGPVPSPAVVQALTVPEIRSRLAEAVERSDWARADGFDESWQFLAELFDLDQEVSTGIVISRTPLADLCTWLADRAQDAHRIYEWTQFCTIRQEVAQAGAAPILAEVLRGEVSPDEAADAFRARFFRLWLDATSERVPALRGFTTDGHERLICRFQELDRRVIDATPARIRHLLLTHPDRPGVAAGDAPGSSELGTLLREVNKKRRHLPLRKLFAAIPTLLPRLKPCLMMSPLAVSTYLQSPDVVFDLVIFDEASQVRPQDAICAVYRGRQLVVAGDQKQLPPTSFFERSPDGEAVTSDDDEDGAERLVDFESVLDICCTLGLPRRRLRWHYRSRREPLIAFANHHVYGNELVTFPSVHDMAGSPAVAFTYIAEGRWKAGAGGGFNAAEAYRTAELVLEHFREHPDQSLGVIALSRDFLMRGENEGVGLDSSGARSGHTGRHRHGAATSEPDGLQGLRLPTEDWGPWWKLTPPQLHKQLGRPEPPAQDVSAPPVAA